MIRTATDRDVPALQAFLTERMESSMFLLGNLEAHGTADRQHPHGTAFHLLEEDEAIRGVFGVTNGGFLLAQIPGITSDLAQRFVRLLDGYTCQAITGDAAQVALLIDAMGLPEDLWRINAVEPLYRLPLERVSAEAQLRAVTPEDVALLTDWIAAYLVETQTAEAMPLDEQARLRAERAVGGSDLRLMIEEGRAVAMASINARAGRAVQVGGVYVPPELRGKGRAGRVVAALLAEERDAGAALGVLFAASPEAARAYERIGFARCGDYRVALLKDAVLL